MIYYILVLVALVFAPVYGMQDILSDPNIDVVLTYPNVVTQGKDFVIASTIKTKADQISNITVTIDSPELTVLQNQFNVQSISKGSTLGNNFNVNVKQESPSGILLANVSVEYVIKGFFDESPIKKSITKAVEFNVQSKPILILDADAPEAIFAGESFSIKSTIKNQGYDAYDIQIQIDSAQVKLDGKKVYSLTSLEAGKTESLEFVLHTPEEPAVPTDAIISITMYYSDESGKKYNSEDSLNIFVRHRGILEIGGAEGIWVGDFLIAPVVGVGTIVSSVIGFLIFVWHVKNKKKKKPTKKK